MYKQKGTVTACGNKLNTGKADRGQGVLLNSEHKALVVPSGKGHGDTVGVTIRGSDFNQFSLGNQTARGMGSIVEGFSSEEK